MKHKALNGKEYWRSLDQLSDTPEFRKFLEAEFPGQVPELDGPVSRRKFLALMGASMAFAGLAGCRRPVEKIVPYVTAPTNVIPGIAKYYATTMPFGSGSYGLLVRSNEGRPTKIEGNPLHLSSAGKTNARIQAEILNLYDPDRSKLALHQGADSTWPDFVGFWRGQYPGFLKSGGKGLAVLSRSFNSPSMQRLKETFEQTFPDAVWAMYDPVSDENISEGIEVATGRKLQPVYHYEKAQTILSLDADILLNENEDITANLGFANGRRLRSETNTMNRLYVVESGFSITGAMADHRLKLQSSAMYAFVVHLIKQLGALGIDLDLPLDTNDKKPAGLNTEWIAALARDLVQNNGKSVVVAGSHQSAAIHALVYAINDALGNINNAVTYHAQRDNTSSSLKSLKTLAQKLNAGEVDTLFILGHNPVYNTPADLDFRSLLNKPKHTVQLSYYVDETARVVEWHLPQAHFLEAWGDSRSVDGTASVIQPLIEPLFGGHSTLEILVLITTGLEKRGYDIVRETWQDFLKTGGFEESWQKVLHDGVWKNSETDPEDVILQRERLKSYLADHPVPENYGTKSALEVVFKPSPALYDGRYSNNGWMQEMPDPVTKIAWDNAALISPATAGAFGLKTGDVVLVHLNDRSIEIPVHVLPGQADFSVELTFGYGRSNIGKIADGVGVNVYALRNSEQGDVVGGAVLKKTGKRHVLANTQDHSSMEDRPLIREATLSEYRKHPEFAKEMVEHPSLKSLWEEHSYDEGYQWGMAIDLTACSGCNACVIACQSENNVPIVGKEQVVNGREMHWIRLDRYFKGEVEDPEMIFQPVPCQHCENAPCEQVCPVQATVHDSEGLNVMTYNRCIGTRYCSNNCPYKVRRFNFFNYTGGLAETVKMAQNPDVTVRSRGVMEKCTFCLQRINTAKRAAKLEDRRVEDGEIKTACQQACPADAIVFGDINDPESAVSKMKQQNRDYTMLGELNLKTRNTYLAKIRNPNPEIEHLS